MSALLSRDQRVVLTLIDAEGNQAIESMTSGERLARCRALPTMVLRHGPLLSLEYLQAKDAAMASLLRRGVRAALPGFSEEDDWPATGQLAAMETHHFLAVVDATVLVATWIKRLAEAKLQPADAGGDQLSETDR